MTRNGSIASDLPLLPGHTIKNEDDWEKYFKEYLKLSDKRTKELMLGFSPYRSAHIDY